MTPAFDGSAHTGVVDLVHCSPGRFGGLVPAWSAWSAYGPVVFAAPRRAASCPTRRMITREACPAPGDRSFRSDHTAVAACTVADFKIWAGPCCPHHIAAGVVVDALVAALAVRRRLNTLARRITSTRPRPPALAS
ncbi:hypothetical protein ABZT06_14160 [Streptomyces sp. NPDC005483]|uniref:hypothetical protein n=1 Tax=Streptomyces sp. NPDC005483 TaxID=3154882 RepID=UPI0033B4A829